MIMKETTMNQTKFAFQEALHSSFDAVFANWRFFLPLMIGLSVISFIMYFAVSLTIGSNSLSQISTIIINSAIAFALFKISFNFLDRHQFDRKDLFGPGELLLKYIGASLLFWIMVYLGLMLLVVPGIYVLLTYGFYGLVMVDKKLGPIDALKRSAEITKGSKRSLFVLGIKFYFGLLVINLFLLILVLAPFVVLGALGILLQGMHLLRFSDLMPVLMPVGIVIVFLAIGLLDTIIVIPAYALTFASIYRVLEPRPSDAVETAPIQMQDGDGENTAIDPVLSDSTDDKSAEKTL
jgi:Protein of unknown function (DUF975).